jgi:hypothetical protein
MTRNLVCGRKKEFKHYEKVVTRSQQMGVDQASHSRFANLQLLKVCFLSIFSNYDLGRRIEIKSLGISM